MTMKFNGNDVVLVDGEREEFFEREEIAGLYGEDVVKSTTDTVEVETVEAEDVPEPSDVVTEIDRYWQAFLELTYAAGKMAAVKALVDNFNEGVYPATRVVHEYYSHEPAYAEHDAYAWRCKAHRKIDEFDALSQQAGYKPMSKRDKEVLLNFLLVRKQRRYCRDNARRMQKRQEIMSVKELVVKCYWVQRKRKASE